MHVFAAAYFDYNAKWYHGCDAEEYDVLAKLKSARNASQTAPAVRESLLALRRHTDR